MGKITDYPKVQTLTDDNVFLTDGPNGTKGILAKVLADQLLGRLTTPEIMDNINLLELEGEPSESSGGDQWLLLGTDHGNRYTSFTKSFFYKAIDRSGGGAGGIVMRRNLYRGNNLGSVVTDAQWAEIKSGDFTGMFLGDYWSIGDVTWRIVDFDYWTALGYAACTEHHLVIMPDRHLYTGKMNSTETTNGGYVGSEMYKTGLSNAKTIINGAFGANHVLKHKEYLVNATVNGIPSGAAWLDSTVEIPSELMMYGTHIISPGTDSTSVPVNHTISFKQLAGLQLNPRLILLARSAIWLRDSITGSDFAYLANTGLAAATGANATAGVRPVFGLVG